VCRKEYWWLTAACTGDHLNLQQKFFQRRLPSWFRPIWFPAITALIVLVSGAVLIDGQRAAINEDRLRSTVAADVALIRAKLEGNINSNLQLVRGLVSTISTEPGMDQARFSALVGNLFEEQSQLRSIAAAPDLVIAMIYPFDANRQAIGLDYRMNDAQRVEALRARDTGKMVLAGPVDLVQGGRGFIGRFPVFTGEPSDQQFWGLVSAVVDVDRLYRDSGLVDPNLAITVSLSAVDALGKATGRFFGPDIAAQSPVTASVVLPSGSWEIAAIPDGGWAVAQQGIWQVRLALFLAGALILLPIIVTARWISERHTHFRELQSREAALQSLSRRQMLALDASPVGVSEIDMVSGEVVWDDRLKQIYGQPVSADTGDYARWSNTIHPEDRAQADADFHAGTKTGRYRSQFRIVHPDGSVHYIRANGALYHDRGSNPKMLIVNWDVTADITLTEKLKAREAQLERVSERLGLALDVSKIGVWELDLETGIETWDERMHQLYGLSMDGRTRSAEQWRAMVHAEDRERAQADFDRMLPTGRYESSYRVARPDGTVRHIKSVGAVQTETNANDRIVGVNWDITEDLKLNEELRLAQQLTEAHNRELEAARVSIEYNALHDVLTGLPNRRYLDEKMRSIDQDGLGGMAVLHMDLDRFKQINDTLGHAAGDAMLVRASSVLRENCRESDFVARVGGDEFVVLTTMDAGRIYLATLAEQIVKQMRLPVSFQGHECRFGVSIGIAMDSGTTIDCKRLLINADIALYRAKRRGRNRFEFFTDALQAEVVRTTRVADEILSGLERNEFVTYYQPQFDAHTLDVVGVESLVRWMHPTEGIKYPDSFLAVAEELSVVSSIDRMILEHSLADLDRWEAAGIYVPRASVNVSQRRLHDEDLIAGLREMQIKPGRISFELVESIYLDESDAVVASNIEELKKLGIEIEIDDFGTGYASIVSLQKLRPKRLKIDRQLVEPILTDLTQQQLLISIIDIGKAMNIEIVAEGVETMQHARILRDLGCDILQGYAFGKPMSADELEIALHSQAWRQSA